MRSRDNRKNGIATGSTLQSKCRQDVEVETRLPDPQTTERFASRSAFALVGEPDRTQALLRAPCAPQTRQLHGKGAAVARLRGKRRRKGARISGHRTSPRAPLLVPPMPRPLLLPWGVLAEPPRLAAPWQA